MKIIHITDLHFGPYQWTGNNDILLERLNAFGADLVFNTGDITTDSLENEFQEAQSFLGKIKCDNLVSIMGNHDKFNMRSKEFFSEYIYNGEFVEPKDISKVKKSKVYINKEIASLNDYLYEASFVRLFNINGEAVMIVVVDTCVMHQHTGAVEEEILHALSDIIESTSYDRLLMLTHHPLLFTDNDPLYCSKHLATFMVKHKIEASFSGHTHELGMTEVKDIVHNHSYRQFTSGSMSNIASLNDVNMYCSYENFGAKDEKITVTRMYPEKNGDIKFIDTVIK